MDDGRQFLENQIKTASEKYEAKLAALQALFTETDNAGKDVRAFQSALEAYTRDSETPYHAPVDFSWKDFLDGLSSLIHTPPPNGNRPRANQKEESPKPEVPTKRSIVMDIVKKAGEKGISNEQVLELFPKDSSFTIDIDGVWRIMPKLVRQGLIERTGRGVYRWIGDRNGQPNETESQNGLFEGKIPVEYEKDEDDDQW